MSLTQRYRSVIIAVVVSAGIAAAITVFIARSQPGRVYYFMPGPLGRVVAPLGEAERADTLKPGFITRAIGLRSGAETEWGSQNGVTPALFFSHNLANVFPRELYATHPDFFPLADGKRLDPPPGYNYWNPDLGREDVAQYAAAAAKQYFASHPDAVSFSLGVNDGLVFGESAETRSLIRPQRWFRDRPDYSRLVFTFMNRAAADLAKSYPDKYLGCLAYYWCEDAPDFPVDLHVIPFLTADRAQSYDPAFVKQEFDLQARWARAIGASAQRAGNAETLKTEKLKSNAQYTDRLSGSGHDFSVSAFQRVSVSAEPRLQPRLGLYDYLDDYGFPVPRVPIHAFAEHIRHAHEVGFTDYYGESSRNWGLDGPMPWVIAQLLQNPEQDVDRLLDVYYQNYFGSAAEPMRAFFARCEQQWMRQPGRSYWLKHYRNESQAKLFPPEVCRELRRLLNEAVVLTSGNAEKLKTDTLKSSKAMAASGSAFSISASQRVSVSGPSVYARRVAFVSDSFGVTERFVAFQYAREALARATLHRTVTAAQLDTYLNARREFIEYSHEIVHRWPLAFYPIGYDDWLSDDPAFAAANVLNADTLKTEKLKSDAGTTVSGTAGQNFSVSAFQRVSVSPSAPELLPNGSFNGPLIPGRRIAGLAYGIDLPAPWQSKVEPMEHAVGLICREAARTGSEGLRIGGAESTAVYQWLPATAGKLYAGSAMVRGTVSPSAVVMLTISWLDAHQRRIGDIQAMRLPEGRWPTWVQLQQGGRAPANAAWVGIGVRVEHQSDDDSVDFDDFSVRRTD